MLRSAFVTSLLVLALGLASSAQVTVSNGYATPYPGVTTPQIANTITTYGIPSVPAINTPVAHVGPAAAPPTVPGETMPATAVTVTPQQGEVVEIQNPAPLTVQVAPGNGTAAATQPMNLGVSSAEVNPFVTGGQTASGESLADAARALKSERQTVNAKTYTNADIDRLNQQSGVSSGLNANAQNDNWPSNNGVISPEPQGAIAAPAQNQSTTGTLPSATPSQNATPAPVNNNPPQAMNAKPSAGTPYEMAQNNPSNAGIPQNAEQSTDATDNNASAPATLPKTASRLPLLGVLGFFSISMGLFVRYQREKAK